ncbi:enoyl-CoA hydratase/isomerase family protein [Streptomyces sp. NPDC004065]|uniref:enoyl-CoA hydratase/isomerase family protein n=1 Tax=Streptomyces sp. NPDC004065 TaxID=3364689 RepID=UPI00384B90BB
MTTDDVVVERTGPIGRIILNRPHALNALTLPMIEAIDAALDLWSGQNLRAVTIESSSDRAFCSGGDIRQVRQNTLDGDAEANDRFFATEYEVNRKLGDYPVPVVSLIDGLCMGGGLGLSVHGPFRVVSEKASFAMPETQIGFFPDVGGSYFLPRLPGHIGTYLGLTGSRIGAADALAIGIATHACSHELIGSVPELLAEHDGPVDTLLKDLGPATLRGSALIRHRHRIAHCFAAPELDGPDGIVRRLEGDATPWSRETLAMLRSASPYSLAVTTALLAWGRERSLGACLAMERAAARHVVTTPDFVEGVRAALVDKDRHPRWAQTPATVPDFDPGACAHA